MKIIYHLIFIFRFYLINSTQNNYQNIKKYLLESNLDDPICNHSFFKNANITNINSEKYSLVNTLTGHSFYGIFFLLKLSNGMLVSIGYDNTIRIWDSNDNFYPIKTLSFENTVYIIKELSNGLLVSAGDYKSISIWDPNNNFSLVKNITDQSERILSLTQLSNGMLASGCYDQTIKIWNPYSNFSLVNSINVNASVDKVINLSNGMLASESKDLKLKIWDSSNNYKLLKTIPANIIYSLTTQLSNGLVASVTYEKTILIMNPDNNYNIEKNFTGHNKSIISLYELSNGLLVSTSLDATIKIWNITNKFSLVFDINSINYSEKLIELPNGNLASICIDNIIRIWDCKKSYSLLKELRSHGNTVLSIINLSNGLFATGSADKVIKVWDSKNDYSLIKNISGHGDMISSLIQLSNGLLVSGSWDKSFKVWNSNYNYSSIKTVKIYSNVNKVYQLSNDMIVIGSYEKDINIFNISNDFSLFKTLSNHTNGVSKFIQLSNGILASGSDDTTIKIWDPSNNFTLIKTLEGHQFYISNLVQLSNGMLASASYDKTIRLWDPYNNYKLVQILNGNNFISSFIELTSGLLASGGENNVIRIWSYSNNYSIIYNLTGHTNAISCFIELSNGMLASGSFDKSIKIWNPDKNFSLVNSLIGHSNKITYLVQLFNGMLASASDDSTIVIWDPTENFTLVHIFKGHSLGISSFLQMKNGDLVSGSFDKDIKIWSINYKSMVNFTNLLTNCYVNDNSVVYHYTNLIALNSKFSNEEEIYNKIYEGMNYDSRMLDMYIISTHVLPSKIFKLKELYKCDDIGKIVNDSIPTFLFKIIREDRYIKHSEFVDFDFIHDLSCTDKSIYGYLEFYDNNVSYSKDILVDNLIDKYYKNIDQNITILRISDKMVIDFKYTNKNWKRNFIYSLLCIEPVSYKNSLNIKNICEYYDYTILDKDNYLCVKNPNYNPDSLISTALPFFNKPSLISYSLIDNFEIITNLNYLFSAIFLIHVLFGTYPFLMRVYYFIKKIWLIIKKYCLEKETPSEEEKREIREKYEYWSEWFDIVMGSFDIFIDLYFLLTSSFQGKWLQTMSLVILLFNPCLLYILCVIILLCKKRFSLKHFWNAFLFTFASIFKILGSKNVNGSCCYCKSCKSNINQKFEKLFYDNRKNNKKRRLRFKLTYLFIDFIFEAVPEYIIKIFTIFIFKQQSIFTFILFSISSYFSFLIPFVKLIETSYEYCTTSSQVMDDYGEINIKNNIEMYSNRSNVLA